MTDTIIYHITTHLPGCLPDGPGQWTTCEDEANAIFEGLAIECQAGDYLADVDEYDLNDDHVFRYVMVLPDGADRIELSDVVDALGYAAACVYAAAIDLPFNHSHLARDLCNLGPWSWASDVWTCPEAVALVADCLNSQD